MSDLSGKKLQSIHIYEIGALIHKGPLSTLYHANWTAFDLGVVIQRYEGLTRLPLHMRDRSRITTATQHRVGRFRAPHLPEVIDAAHDPDAAFVALRLPAGVLLETYIKKTGPLPVGETIKLCRQIARALKTTRDEEIIHRAPTPDRVWRTHDGEFILLGTGEALYRANIYRLKSDQQVELLWHMPPEAFKGTPIDPTLDRPAGAGPQIPEPAPKDEPEDDPRAEVFSLACLCYYALSGNHPFFIDRNDPSEGIRNLLKGEPLEIDDIDEDSDLWRVIRRGLQSDPNHRLENPIAFATALEEAGTLESPDDLHESRLSSTSEIMRRIELPRESRSDDLRRYKTIINALVVTTVVLAILSAFLLVRPRFKPHTLVITSNPPGLTFGEETGHLRTSLGRTPIFLEDRDLATPLQLYTISSAGAEGPVTTVHPAESVSLGDCRHLTIGLNMGDRFSGNHVAHEEHDHD